jgi:L-lactate dehydrogenase complex protein LldF
MSTYRQRAATEIREQAPSRTTTPIMRKLVDDSRGMLSRTPFNARDRAEEARAYAVEHLEELHEQVQQNFARRGIGYHRAGTADEAVEIVRRLLGGAKRVAKSKTMVGEEVGLTHALRAAGIDVLETDIGEYIVDIEGRGPSHITAPAIHLNRARIRDLLARTGADLPDDDPVRLSRFVRDVVGDYFRDCDAGITGANAVIASSGRVVIIENEGNVSLGLSHPKLHIVITGIEKVVADEAAALAVLEVLAPAATAQPLTSFTNIVADPLPGQQRHVVFVDNGRSAIARDERYREALKCIRCAACMNACPVYRTAGGLAYGAPYMGPIGAVISPLIWTDGRYADLPFASSLCGSCTEVCPVGIPLHRMLLDLRADAVENEQAGSFGERAGWRAWSTAFAGARTARAATALGRFALKHGGHLVRGGEGDPRELPPIAPRRDPAMLEPAAPPPEPAVIAPAEVLTDDLVGLFIKRAEEVGVQVAMKVTQEEGDIELRAAAGIANTGSVLLTGESALRRPLLAAKRVIVRLDPDRIVRFPAGVEPHLGDGEALILTGASRTADIEKQIVRGIHGSEELIVVLEQAGQ